MRSVVYACLISIASAAPNGGYNYVTPNYNNFVGSASSGSQHVHHHHIVPQQQQQYQQQYQHQQYQQQNVLDSGNTGHGTGFNHGFSFNPAPALPAFNYQTSGGHRHQQGQRRVLPPLVSKHIYIHSAPEEPDEDIVEDNSVEQERRHYNIVFIKAPSQTVRKTALTVAQALNEQKTVIYVLSKKNDVTEIKQALSDVKQKPTKPEVFFIKYRTPEEAQHAQHTIQAQYDALGGTTKISDEGYAPVSSVIGQLGGNGGGGFIGNGGGGGFIGNGANSIESGEGQLISSGSGISSIGGNGISSGSGNLIIGGSSSYLPPNKIK